MSETKMRGVRGAITVDVDESKAIFAATKRLLICMTKQNEIKLDDIASILFSVTPDLHAAFPALGARELGWVDIPMLHCCEIDVHGALPRVIRVLMHVNTARLQNEIEHIYLDGARVLRPDLAKVTVR